MIPRAEYPADVHNATDSNGGEGVVVDVAAAVPVTFVAILIIVLITYGGAQHSTQYYG